MNAVKARELALEHGSTLKSEKTKLILERIQEACRGNKFSIQVTRDELDGTTEDFLHTNGYRKILHTIEDRIVFTIVW